MTYKDMLWVAMSQSAIELNCRAEDFCAAENKIVTSACNDGARKYLELPFFCQLVSYGGNVVASADERIQPFVEQYIAKYDTVHCFETPSMHVLNDELQKYDHRVCFMAEYYLPDPDIMKPMDCHYELRVMNPENFAEYYLPEWSNALCEKRKLLDVLAMGAFDGEKLIGLAGCSADCDSMWQIGVDVLPEYRRNGIAAALTSRLAFEIMERGKVPFYCAAWSNIKSARNAMKCGFKPSWVEMTAKSVELVDKMNNM